MLEIFMTVLLCMGYYCHLMAFMKNCRTTLRHSNIYEYLFLTIYNTLDKVINGKLFFLVVGRFCLNLQWSMNFSKPVVDLTLNINFCESSL